MAIYTALTKKEIVKIADEFALGDLVAYSGIKNGSVNTHYFIETKRGKYFAKIDEVKSELELKQELDLLCDRIEQCGCVGLRALPLYILSSPEFSTRLSPTTDPPHFGLSVLCPPKALP